MIYNVTNEFTKISETAGTIQNMSNVYAVEVSNKAEADSGIILYPLNRISVTLSECYLRCVDGGNAEVRVVPFEVDVTRGGGIGVLDTVPSTVDGALWYEVNNNVLTLKLHAGNYNYGFKHDLITYTGGNSHLVAYLPFDISTTADACGNEWVTVGSPTITDGALYLDGSSYLSRVGGITLGGQDFTIDFRLTYADGRYTNYTNFWGFGGGGVYNRITTCSTPSSVPYILSLNEVQAYANDAYSFADTRHIATVYQHESQTLNLYIDGVRVATLQTVIPRQTYPKFVIGAGDQGDYPARGSINHFRINDGVALWTTDFTPPTAADYA